MTTIYNAPEGVATIALAAFAPSTGRNARLVIAMDSES